MALSFPPFNLWPLAPLCLLPLWFWAGRCAPAAAFSVGWLWGMGQFAAGMYWLVYVMTSYGGMPPLLALLPFLLLCAYLSLYTGLCCCLLAALLAGTRNKYWWLAAPFFWTGLEFLRGIALTGFPWLSLSLTLSDEPLLLQSAEIWGASGLSFFIVLCSVLLAQVLGLLKAGGMLPRIIGAALILTMAAAFWGGGRLMLERTEEAMTSQPQALVSVVQGNIPLERLWQKNLRAANLMEQLSLSEKAAAQAQTRPWLLLWSESAAPFIFLTDTDNSMRVLRQAANLRAWLVTGTTGLIQREEGTPGYTNRLFLVSPEGEPYDYYDKVHLVPFGEYVPLSRLLFFVRALAALAVDMQPGREGKTMRAGEICLGPLICYESIFPELARQHKRNGANLLVNPTNDAWFGPSGASAQHLGQLALRAVENRLAAARAANTGISGFILPTGRIIEKTELFTQDARTASLPLNGQTTFFSRHGELAGWLGLAGVGLFGLGHIAAARFKRKKKHAG